MDEVTGEGAKKSDDDQSQGVSRRRFLEVASATAGVYAADAVLKPGEAEAHRKCIDRDPRFRQLAATREGGRVRRNEVVVDPVYATKRNFTGKPVPGYEAKEAWIHPDVAGKLEKVQTYVRNELMRKGFNMEMAAKIHLIVKDGYRPHKATEAMAGWAKENRVGRGYISRGISGHNQGKTIDVALGIRVNDDTIREIWMGSRFDEFSHHSNHGQDGRKLDSRRDNPYSYQGLGYRTPRNYSTLTRSSRNAFHRNLRNALKAAMRKAGGRSMKSEIWHYRFGAGQCFDRDID